MINYSIEKEYEEMIEAYQKAGGDRDALLAEGTARLVVHENRVLGKDAVEGIKIETRETETGVDVNLLVEEGVKVPHPVHLCFGMLPQEGLQEIIMRVNAKDNSEVNVIAHCIFPNAVKVIHKMDADIEIGNNARFDYKETHYHGDYGGIEVIPRAKVKVGKRGVYQSSMAISQGRVGRLDYDFDDVATRQSFKVVGEAFTPYR